MLYSHHRARQGREPERGAVPGQTPRQPGPRRGHLLRARAHSRIHGVGRWICSTDSIGDAVRRPCSSGAVARSALDVEGVGLRGPEPRDAARQTNSCRATLLRHQAASRSLRVVGGFCGVSGGWLRLAWHGLLRPSRPDSSSALGADCHGPAARPVGAQGETTAWRQSVDSPVGHLCHECPPGRHERKPCSFANGLPRQR